MSRHRPLRIREFGRQAGSADSFAALGPAGRGGARGEEFGQEIRLRVETTAGAGGGLARNFSSVHGRSCTMKPR